MKPLRKYAMPIAVLLLSACAGGGGGSKTSSSSVYFAPPPADTPCGTTVCVPFRPASEFPQLPPLEPYEYIPLLSAWSAVAPGSKVFATGLSSRTVYNLDANDVPVGTFPSIANGSIVFQFDDHGKLIAFKPKVPDEGFSAPTIDGAVALKGDLGVIGHPEIRVNVDAWNGSVVADRALVVEPSAAGWDYQAFGAWGAGDPGAGLAHALSVGAFAPASGVPIAGTGRFIGRLAGHYVSPSGQAGIAVAALTINADFANRTLDFASSGTVVTRNFQSALPAPNLDLRGTLAYSPSQGTITGTLVNAGGSLSGPTKAHFYGPAAQEVGGVFALKTILSVESFVGAYGAKR